MAIKDKAVPPHPSPLPDGAREPERNTRRARGGFYTPQWLAHHIAARGLCKVTQSYPRVMDLACGDGVLLCQALHLLAQRNKTPYTVAARLDLVRRCISGVDIDAAAVEAARGNVAGWIFDNGALPGDLQNEVAETVAACIVQADALLMEDAGGRFDIILGNPPYLSIRQLHQTHGAAYVRSLRKQYRCARGSFDSYVLFVEKAQQLLREGAWCTMITPGRLADMEYARPCRQLLLGNTLHQIDDLSSVPSLFRGVSVYAHIYTWQKRPPAAGHQTEVSEFVTDGARAKAQPPHFIPQAELTADGFAVHRQAAVLDNIHTKPLSEFATVLCGAAGFSAQLLAGELREAGEVSSTEDAMPFVVSGNIDRYQLRPGNVRFMKRKFDAPVLPASSSYFNPARRQLYEQPKIVVAGMTRRLEAAYVTQPLAIGVQTYAVKSRNIDEWLLLGLLNSRLVSHWFASRFAARRLAGGFLAINKSQLEQIPIPIAAVSDDKTNVDLQQQIATIAQTLHQSDNDMSLEKAEQKLDELVYRLYALDAATMAAVQNSDLPPAVTGGSY